MRKRDNYLDYVPRHNVLLAYKKKENGRVEIEVFHRGFYHRIAQIFFKKPQKSYIELDELASFVWEQVDGKRTIYDICLLIKEHFGESAEPLFERAVTFFRILRRNAFIEFEITVQR